MDRTVPPAPVATAFRVTRHGVVRLLTAPL
jgi:hypothetical protein